MMLLLQNVLNACEQLWANKLRSVLTVLGVIIAVTSTLVVVAVVERTPFGSSPRFRPFGTPP